MFEESENIFPTKPSLNALNKAVNWPRIVFIIALLFLFSTFFNTINYVFLIEVMIVLFIHELGHYLTMLLLKVKSQGLFFMSFLNKLTKDLSFSQSQKEQVIINLMGPIPGLIIGMVCLLFIREDAINEILLEIGVLFLLVNLINILPLDPFDGGRVFQALFFKNRERYKLYFTLFSSFLIILFGILSGVWLAIIFGLLMGLKVRSAQKNIELHDLLNREDVDFKKEYKELSDKEYWKIRSIFLEQNPKIKEIIPNGFTLWENERLLMEQVNQILRIKLKSDLSFAGKILVIIIVAFMIYLPLQIIFNHSEILEWYINHE
jgi:stage IV sporulation protein FB